MIKGRGRISESLFAAAACCFLLASATGCNLVKRGEDEADDDGGGEALPPLRSEGCVTVGEGFGPTGLQAPTVDVVVEGLETPWGLAFVDERTLLVTERAGRLRLVQDGALVPEPVLSLPVSQVGESGLLGIALDPEFQTSRLFYLYYTAEKPGVGAVNRVERFKLADDSRSAVSDRVVLDDVKAARKHDGGRLRFGPDGMLYVGTGDAAGSALSQDVASPNGKILRLTPDGAVPGDNPFPGHAAFVTGVRNTQGFDWFDDHTLLVTDHGPSGELGRKGHDEVSVARAGDNLGWPDIYGCGTKEGMRTPILAWRDANPPGGAVIYRGSVLRGWTGSLLMTTLGSKHLHRIVVDPADPSRLKRHEIYLAGDEPSGYGRLREIVEGPDGAVYVTTSNCDGNGTCPAAKDKILRLR